MTLVVLDAEVTVRDERECGLGGDARERIGLVAELVTHGQRIDTAQAGGRCHHEETSTSAADTCRRTRSKTRS